MPTNVLHYHSDGANRQVQAVLAFFQYRLCGGIEDSWNTEWKQYDAEIEVARWENCREQGYVLMLHSKNRREQLNIVFFEHRNSDNICAVKWQQRTMNSPTIDTIAEGAYTNKWDTSFDVPYGEAMEMANWLLEQFETFWTTTSKE